MGKYLALELPDNMVNLSLPIRGTAGLFSKATVLFTFLQALYESSNFSTSCPTLVIICFLILFYYSHPSGCEVLSHGGFGLYFPDG